MKSGSEREIEFSSLDEALSYVRILQKPIVIPETKHKTWKPKQRERVDGGDPVRVPVDRVAARVVSPAPWWAMPPDIQKKKEPILCIEKPKTKKKKPKMKTISETSVGPKETVGIPGQTYISDAGVKIVMVNGTPMMSADDVRTMICSEIAKLPKETRPAVRAAEDARQIIKELTDGIGGDMEKFRADTKRYLEDIRGTRFSMVTETSQMVGPLKEVRQFFLGGDYKEEVARLKEFVDLCERLNTLKESGFLDNVADTMLGLSVK